MTRTWHAVHGALFLLTAPVIIPVILVWCFVEEWRHPPQPVTPQGDYCPCCDGTDPCHQWRLS